MKPPPFGYSRPDTVEEAVAVLADRDPDGKVLAGGQSLLPLLNMRLATPGHLVDINKLSDLSYVRVIDGHVVIGALARHADVLADQDAARAQPLIRQALALVAHQVIRNRGTTVGSIVHADPAGEMTAVLALLGGSVVLMSTGGERLVQSSEFFLGPLESDVRPDELATQVRIRVLPERAGTAFAEVSRRNGDYAVCGVAVLAELDEADAVGRATAVYLSLAGTPLVLDLSDAAGDPAAAGRMARDRVSPSGDIHATAAYRKHLAGVLTERALADAIAAARKRSVGSERSVGRERSVG
ncbi:MAG: FAD binding domain-containing protein [Nocardiopsaceae bacterium]|nr:FAD binding domain-containing protein [Nocardiopsaceae bacterium]